MDLSLLGQNQLDLEPKAKKAKKRLKKILDANGALDLARPSLDKTEDQRTRKAKIVGHKKNILAKRIARANLENKQITNHNYTVQNETSELNACNSRF